jgi:RNA polymerase subunit RPABC4/transcription elongation factor Spt4
MTSNELYKKAYDAQFQEKNLSEALKYYQQLIALFPNSLEAGYAKEQIEVLFKDNKVITPSIPINLPPVLNKDVSKANCSSCGRQIVDAQASFCPYCGTRIETPGKSGITQEEAAEIIRSIITAKPEDQLEKAREVLNKLGKTLPNESAKAQEVKSEGNNETEIKNPQATQPKSDPTTKQTGLTQGAPLLGFYVGTSAYDPSMGLSRKFSQELNPIQKTEATNSPADGEELREKVNKYNLNQLIMTPVVAIFSMAIMGGISAAVLALLRETDVIPGCLMILGVISIGMAVVMTVGEYQKRCPSCGAWGQARADEKKRELISSMPGYKTVTRTDEVKNSRGEKVGETTRQVQVRVLTKTYRNHYDCFICKHHWTDTDSEDTENFHE